MSLATSGKVISMGEELVRLARRHVRSLEKGGSRETEEQLTDCVKGLLEQEVSPPSLTGKVALELLPRLSRLPEKLRDDFSGRLIERVRSTAKQALQVPLPRDPAVREYNSPNAVLLAELAYPKKGYRPQNFFKQLSTGFQPQQREIVLGKINTFLRRYSERAPEEVEGVVANGAQILARLPIHKRAAWLNTYLSVMMLDIPIEEKARVSTSLLPLNNGSQLCFSQVFNEEGERQLYLTAEPVATLDKIIQVLGEPSIPEDHYRVTLSTLVLYSYAREERDACARFNAVLRRDDLSWTATLLPLCCATVEARGLVSLVVFLYECSEGGLVARSMEETKRILTEYYIEEPLFGKQLCKALTHSQGVCQTITLLYLALLVRGYFSKEVIPLRNKWLTLARQVTSLRELEQVTTAMRHAGRLGVYDSFLLVPLLDNMPISDLKLVVDLVTNSSDYEKEVLYTFSEVFRWMRSYEEAQAFLQQWSTIKRACPLATLTLFSSALSRLPPGLARQFISLLEGLKKWRLHLVFNAMELVGEEELESWVAVLTSCWSELEKFSDFETILYSLALLPPTLRSVAPALIWEGLGDISTEFVGEVVEYVWRVTNSRAQGLRHLYQRFLTEGRRSCVSKLSAEIILNGHSLRISENCTTTGLSASLMKEARYIREAVLDNGRDQSYRLYDRQSQLKRLPISFFGHRYSWRDKRISLNFSAFSSHSLAMIPRARLPFTVGADALTELGRDLTRRATPKVQRAIKNSTGIEWSALRSSFFEAVYLQNLLQVGSELTRAQAYFITLLHYVREQSNEVPDGEELSPRDQVLCQLAASIQACDVGKEGGIIAAYHNIIPLEKRLEPLSPEEGAQEQGVHNGLRYMEEFLGTFLSHAIDNTTFLDTVLGASRVKGMRQRVHQVRYIRNMIGPFLGLQKHIEFDVYAYCITKHLRKWTRDELLLHLDDSEALTPISMMTALQQKVNREVNDDTTLYGKLSALIDDSKLTLCWGVDDDGEISLTEFGALTLLERMEYCEVFEGPEAI